MAACPPSRCSASTSTTWVELPSSIGQLTRLIDLSVLGNPILELPWALGNCTSIRSFKVDWDVEETPPFEISSLGIPSVISFLAHVDSAIHESALALNGYQMKTLPMAVCRLTSLTKLSLETQPPHVFPPGIRQPAESDAAEHQV